METYKWPVRVYIEDTDFGGIVYYANYLKFMERARTEWLRTFGVSQESLGKQDLLFVVTGVEVKYIKPAKLDDNLVVTVNATLKGKTSLLFTQSVQRGEGVGDSALATGSVTVTAVNRNGKPCRLPEFIKTHLIESGV